MEYLSIKTDKLQVMHCHKLCGNISFHGNQTVRSWDTTNEVTHTSDAAKILVRYPLMYIYHTYFTIIEIIVHLHAKTTMSASAA